MLAKIIHTKNSKLKQGDDFYSTCSMKHLNLSLYNCERHLYIKYFLKIKNSQILQKIKSNWNKMSEIPSKNAEETSQMESLALETSGLDLSHAEESETSEIDNKKRREAFGNRHLNEKQDVFEFNAWYLINNTGLIL